MYSSQDGIQETFDLEDEEAAAVWDLDDIEVERLRAAPSQSQRDSLGGVSGLLGGDTPAGGLKQGGPCCCCCLMERSHLQQCSVIGCALAFAAAAAAAFGQLLPAVHARLFCCSCG
jgi:hypothetical protein